MATPFVQGRLRNSFLCCTIRTKCGHCGRSMVIELDSELNYRMAGEPKEPLVFLPFVDIGNLKEPSIIDAF